MISMGTIESEEQTAAEARNAQAESVEDMAPREQVRDVVREVLHEMLERYLREKEHRQ